MSYKRSIREARDFYRNMNLIVYEHNRQRAMISNTF